MRRERSCPLGSSSLGQTPSSCTLQPWAPVHHPVGRHCLALDRDFAVCSGPPCQLYSLRLYMCLLSEVTGESWGVDKEGAVLLHVTIRASEPSSMLCHCNSKLLDSLRVQFLKLSERPSGNARLTPQAATIPDAAECRTATTNVKVLLGSCTTKAAFTEPRLHQMPGVHKYVTWLLEQACSASSSLETKHVVRW